MISHSYKLNQKIINNIKKTGYKILCAELTKANSTQMTFHIKKLHEKTMKKHCKVYTKLKPNSKLFSHVVSTKYVHHMVHEEFLG